MDGNSVIQNEEDVSEITGMGIRVWNMDAAGLLHLLENTRELSVGMLDKKRMSETRFVVLGNMVALPTVRSPE